MKSTIKLKRVYEAPHKDDGIRILVDRLWPRGLTKKKAKVDLWLKEIAPSTELRKWFGHDPKKWGSFSARYRTEIKHHADQLKLLESKAKEGTVSLMFGARDEEHNEAVVLKDFLERSGSGRSFSGAKAFLRPLPQERRLRCEGRGSRSAKPSDSVVQNSDPHVRKRCRETIYRSKDRGM